MTHSRASAAPHVQAAIDQGLGRSSNAALPASSIQTAAPSAKTDAALSGSANALKSQARADAGTGTAAHVPAAHLPAAHVQAAIDRGLGATAQPRASTAQAMTAKAAQHQASHVQAAIDHGRGGAVQAWTALGAIQASATDFVSYTDVKSPTSPPAPPRLPVFSLRCGDGGDCSLQDLKTGRTRPAGDLYAGYVRVSPGGPVYISPRPDIGLQGDSHPSIASVTPEERRGRGAIVAAGEVGFIDNQIVGHNDKTGHYRTRRNYWQSGMPAEKYHSFTEDPHDWYLSPQKKSQ